MKKILSAALLALGISALSAQSASAGAFGLFYHNCCWGCCGGCNVCLRPYNAFTPVVSGNLCCDGCVPFCPTGAYAGGACGPVGAGPLCGGACDGGACGLGELPPVSALPAAPSAIGVAGVPQMPAAPIVYGMPQGNVSSAGYRPAFYPGYGSAPVMPPQAPAANVPVYWNR
jgi:hypothetical protein